jgi:hypothetical protein
MNLTDQFDQFSEFTSDAKLTEQTRLAIAFSPEEFTHLIPSFVLGQDGPSLKKIVFISPNYMCDVDLLNDAQQFDFIAIKSIKNYRFELRLHKSERENLPPLQFDVAQVELLHSGFGGSFRTRLEYVGTKRDEWLKQVMTAIPIKLILS